MKRSGILISAILMAATLWAVDPPHWSSSTTTIDCTSQCHTGHTSLGSALTQAASNVNLCQSCHNNAGLAGNMPVNTTDMAIPGTSGFHHAFGVPAVNASFDTVLPTNSAMALRIMEGNVTCSTCHDQHDAGDSTLGSKASISSPDQVTALGSTGTLSSGGSYSGSGGVWYLVEIIGAGTQATATFRYSKDRGTTWFPTAPATLTAGTDVALDFGVTVTFAAGNYTAGERWQFSASWPYLRAALDSGDNTTGVKFCRDCHTNWAMTHGESHTYDGSVKSHPVGIALNANGNGYDRAVPQDGNGAAQGGGGADSNTSNNLLLDSGGLVQCYTCHGVHYADGNTLTEDGP
ncbi:MAG TPA: cytochrome c3 family protein [Thermoanaerobaculia bacterium]|nr:cytochrome c3 family protein [Thermoanaerobaculia bacterium]HUM29121.1 cytochrome c3 family protein [Thermoanaerobaculia bacterium]HXK67498.1 cytochrome c3 family protein [Thermoanaerobaculia bacterium]